MNSNLNETVRRVARAVALLVAVTALAVPSIAQENQLSPPEALQFPFEAAREAPRSVAALFLRAEIERSADLALCQVLMTEAGRPIPSPFEAEDCEPAFAEKVENDEGIVHWASGARPLECEDTCIGRPILGQSRSLTRPNLRQVEMNGKLEFVADPPGPFNRTLTYHYNITSRCAAENGARTGDFELSIDIRDPVIGDPGPIESILDFFGSGNLSAFIERRMNDELTSVGPISQNLGRCLSIGVFRGTSPREIFTNDGAVYDPAPAASGGRARDRLSPVAVGSRDRATVRFLRIVRKTLPDLGGAGQPSPGGLEQGQFSVYLNGIHVVIPPLSPNATGTLDLPPVGEAVELDYCRTVDVTDYDRLQLLFTNGLGGAVWSQFARADDFGADALRRMTTGRGVRVPATPPETRPRVMTVREFELVYTITYAPKTDTAAPAPRASPRPRPGPVTRRGGINRPRLQNAPVVATDSSAPAPGPCRQI